MIRYTMLSIGLLSAAGFAQDKVDLTIGETKKPVRYTIESRSSTTTEREILIDGEPMEGRGGFGGAGGPIANESKVVFDEGRDGSTTWRVYREAKAKIEMPGRDGEQVSNEIEGGMLGDRLLIVEDDRGVVVRKDAEDAEELPAMMTRGMPARTSFAGITPKEPIAVGSEFDLPAGFLAAMQSINHPVRPAMDPNAVGAGRGGQRPPRGGGDAGGADQPQQPRGQGGQGGQRGQGGRFGGAMAMMGGGDQTIQLLTNDKLDGKVVGKLVEVADGIAKIELHGDRAAKGTLEEIGMPALGGRFGGGNRRGGGGGGGAPAIEGSGTVNLKIAGALWIDVANHSLVKLVVEGTTHTSTESAMSRGDREIETNGTSEGTFRYAVHAELAPAAGEGK